MKIIPDFQRLNAGENLSRKIVLDAGNTVSGNKCVLSFITPMGKIYITEEMTLSSGKGEYILPSLLLDGKGVLLCQMSVIGENGYLIKSDIYEFPVYAACDTEDHPEADEESVKSLSAIFELLDRISDNAHDHNGLYYLKEETESLLSVKSDIVHIHDDRYYGKAETDELLAEKLDAEHTHDDRYYGKAEIDGLLAEKLDAEHIHDDRYYGKAETDELLAEKSDTEHIHDDRYYGKAETDELLAEKSDTEHIHDDRYYTESEINQLLSGKSESGHSHSFDELGNKPGDVLYDSLIFSFESLPAPKMHTEQGYVIEFEHNVKTVPFNSIFYVTYNIPHISEYDIMTGVMHYSDMEPLGEIFLACNADVGYEQFCEEGFPEDADEKAFVIHIKTDGTGRIYTKSLLTGCKMSLQGNNKICETWITLPSSAIESTWDVTKNEKTLITSGGVYNALNSHNTEASSHQDIRILLDEMSERINGVLDSDDTTLDQLSEIVSYIKSNKSLIDAVTTGKISYSDIVTNLETNVGNKPLSASMGVALKALIDAIVVPTKVSELTNDAGYVNKTTFDEALFKVERPFVITAAADFQNGVLTNVSRTFSEITEAYARNDHVFLDLDLSQLSSGLRFQINLTSFLSENYATFETIVNLDNGSQSAHVLCFIHAGGSSSLSVIPLVQQTQIDSLTFVVSDTVPSVDDRKVITFVVEE